MSLRRKLVLGIMGTAGLALVLELAVFLGIEIHRSRTSAQRELSVLAEVLAEGAAPSLDFSYPSEAEQLLATLQSQPTIDAARLFDAGGRPFASYERAGKLRAALPQVPPSGAQAYQGEWMWLTRPVRHNGNLLGTIYLRSDLAELKARLRWVLACGLALTLVIAGMATAFAVGLGRRVAGPILNLAEAARWVGEGGSGQRVVSTSRDEVGTLVSAFNRMLDQLQQRQASLEEAQSMAHLGSWTFLPWRDELVFSREAGTLFGLDAAVTGMSLPAFLALVDPDDLPVLKRAVRRALAQGLGFSLDQRPLREDGVLRWAHVTGRPALDEAGRTVVRGTTTDITERKQAEAALRQVQKLESLGVLAGGIAHDFNNLLSALMGNLGLAGMVLPDGAPAAAYLARCEEITQKAANLTRQMLAYSGRGRFEQRHLDLGQAVREMASLLAVSISKKAVLRYHMDPKCPAIVADPTQLQQVVMNLVTNASEALGDEAGSIQVRTAVEELAPGDLAGFHLTPELRLGLYAVLEVEDSGCGMDAGTLECIFDPFFTTKFSGRGLGLAAMLGILKGHHGGIRVRSQPGAGTTFTLLFPAAEVAEEPESEPAVAVPVAGPCSGLALVVDDEPEVRAQAQAILERLGLRVLCAQDGLEALERFREHRLELDVVLLDLTMPRMDGAECFRVIREQDDRVPVILSSGYNEREIRLGFAGLRPRHFLQKPYAPAALMAKVREVMTQGCLVG